MRRESSESEDFVDESVWPTIIIVRSAHLSSVLFGLACHRFGSAPAWLTETLLYNKWVTVSRGSYSGHTS